MKVRGSKVLAVGLAAASALLIGGIAAPSWAEEKAATEPGPWKYGATAGLNFAQSSFSNNWSGGDKGSVVWVLHSDLAAERQFTRKINSSTTLQLAYGQTARQVDDPAHPGQRTWDAPDKTTDLILLESVGRLSLERYVDPYVAFRLDSQFSDESAPQGGLLFNPVKIKETAGVARVIEKTEDRELITRAGFGFRQSFARAFTDTVGTQTTHVMTNDGGFEWQTTMTRPLLEKRVIYKGKLLCYLPVFFSQSDRLKDFDREARAAYPSREEVAGFWKSPDVNWQNDFTAQITEHLNVNLYIQWIYDKYDEATSVDITRPLAVRIAQVDRGIRKAGQFKQTLSLGVTYTLF